MFPDTEYDFVRVTIVSEVVHNFSGSSSFRNDKVVVIGGKFGTVMTAKDQITNTTVKGLVCIKFRTNDSPP